MAERSWLIRGGRLVGRRRILADGAVAVVHGRIAYAGDAAGLPAELPGPGGGLVSLRSLPAVDAGGGYIAPGFIDLHVHGGAGADAMDERPGAFERWCRHHASHGSTAVMATTMTASTGDLLAALERIRVAAAASKGPDWPGARILGIHIEGPYLSEKRAGVQNAAHFRRPEEEEIREILERVRGLPCLITLAPEAPGCMEWIPRLAAAGLRVSMGHTDATYAVAKEAIGRGAFQSTHTFNAMRGLHHRDPGVVGAALESDEVCAEVIADGHHVHPAALGLLYRLKGPGGIALITDAVGMAGLPDGDHVFDGRAVRVEGGACRLPDGTLAGSLLGMDQAVKRMVEEVGVPLTDAVAMASATPARQAGAADRKGRLAAGYDADVVVLDSELRCRYTWVEGRLVHSIEFS